MSEYITCGQYTQLLVDQQPVYDKEIIRDVRPDSGGWIGHVATGQFPAHSGVSLIQDRFNHVYPNTARPWTATSYASCVGNPCAKTENLIGWGATRLSYFLEEQSWATPLVCFDQEMHVTHAKEQWRQIISDILRPATSEIMSMFLRKRALYWAGKRYVAGTNFGTTAGEFNYTWQNDSDGNEVYLLTDKVPTSKLTPQMLQRRVGPLQRLGYFGKSPFGEKENPPYIELVSGQETVWELDHLAGQTLAQGNPSIANYRFEQWQAANQYWRYGFSGKIGNYATRIDPFEMRFNYVGASGNSTYPYKFQLVLPYVNIVSSGAGGAAGLKSTDNPAFELAQYRFSFTWHKQGMEALMMEPTSINPEMPFMSRNWGGKWMFVLPDVCVNQAGVVTPIDNRRRNQGQWLADFKLAIRPKHSEWTEAYFHKAEPSCIYAVDTCNANPGYPTQSYNSANTPC